MAHARRHFFDLHDAHDSPLAKEALERIGGLYQIEDHIRGSSPAKRRAARQQYAVPLLNALHAWMIESSRSSRKNRRSPTAFQLRVE